MGQWWDFLCEKQKNQYNFRKTRLMGHLCPVWGVCAPSKVWCMYGGGELLLLNIFGQFINCRNMAPE